MDFSNLPFLAKNVVLFLSFFFLPTLSLKHDLLPFRPADFVQICCGPSLCPCAWTDYVVRRKNWEFFEKILLFHPLGLRKITPFSLKHALLPFRPADCDQICCGPSLCPCAWAVYAVRKKNGYFSKKYSFFSLWDFEK